MHRNGGGDVDREELILLLEVLSSGVLMEHSRRRAAGLFQCVKPNRTLPVGTPATARNDWHGFQL